MNKGYKLVSLRTISIDAGHRLHNHEGMCANFHGHRYYFDIYYSHAKDSEGKNEIERFHEKLRDWMMIHWDHAMILWQDDPYSTLWAPQGVLHGFKYYLLSLNPTAENLATIVLRMTNEWAKKQDLEMQIVQVDCKETPNSTAHAKL